MTFFIFTEHLIFYIELTENWIHNRENVQNGVVFNMKVLGKKVATAAQGKGCTDESVKEMVQQHKMVR